MDYLVGDTIYAITVLMPDGGSGVTGVVKFA